MGAALANRDISSNYSKGTRWFLKAHNHISFSVTLGIRCCHQAVFLLALWQSGMPALTRCL